MANHKSAAKRARQSIRKSTVNSRAKSTVRTFEKKLLKAISSKDQDSAQQLLTSYESQMDKASQKGVFHPKTASRKISRLAKQVHTLK